VGERGGRCYGSAYYGKWSLVGSKEVKPFQGLIDMTIQHPDDFRLWWEGEGGAWITEGHTTAHSEILGVDSLYL